MLLIQAKLCLSAVTLLVVRSTFTVPSDLLHQVQGAGWLSLCEVRIGGLIRGAGSSPQISSGHILVSQHLAPSAQVLDWPNVTQALRWLAHVS